MNSANAMQLIMSFLTNPANLAQIIANPSNALGNILAIIQGVVPPVVPSVEGNGNDGAGIGGVGSADTAVSNEVQNEPVGVGISH